MHPTSTLVSFTTSATDREFRAHYLKLCCLWYDEVLMNFLAGLVRGEVDDRKTIHALSDIIVPLNRRVDKDTIGDVMDRLGEGYPRWGEHLEHYTYPDPENAQQFAHNKLLEHITGEYGVARLEGIDVEHGEGRARSAVDAIALWGRVNAVRPCMLQANEDEKLAIVAAQQFNGKEKAAAPISLFEALVPSLKEASWKDIARLRNDNSLESLRTRISESMDRAGSDLDKARSLLRELEIEALDLIVEKGRPKVTRIVVESVVSNLPIPWINPFSLYFDGRDVAKAVATKNDVGWLYLLRDVRQAAFAGRKPPPGALL